MPPRPPSTPRSLALPTLLLSGALLGAAPASTAGGNTVATQAAPTTRTLHADGLAARLRALPALPPDARVRVLGLRPPDAPVFHRTSGRTPALELDLAPAPAWSPGAVVRVHGPDGTRERPAPDGVSLRGTVLGLPGSRAVLTLHPDGSLRGLVTTDRGRWLLEAAPDETTPRLEAVADGVTSAPFVCRNGDRATPVPPVGTPSPSGLGAPLRPRQQADLLALDAPARAVQRSVNVPRSVRVAFESDRAFLLRFGAEEDPVAAAAAYVTDLVSFVSSIYEDEVRVRLEVAHLSLWQGDDPWTQTGAECGLHEFGRFWNLHRTDVERSVAHFLSGDLGAGGFAWEGVLCGDPEVRDHGGACPGLEPQSDLYGGGYGYTGDVRGAFDPQDPAILRETFTLAHELGHNLDSPHSHCYAGLGGGELPVDTCHSGEINEEGHTCHVGPVSLPGPAGEGSGTLMSYCHLRSGGLANIGATLGAGHPWGEKPGRIPERMRSHVEAVAAVQPACLPSTRLVFADGFEVGDVGSWSP